MNDPHAAPIDLSTPLGVRLAVDSLRKRVDAMEKVLQIQFDRMAQMQTGLDRIVALLGRQRRS